MLEAQSQDGSKNTPQNDLESDLYLDADLHLEDEQPAEGEHKSPLEQPAAPKIFDSLAEEAKHLTGVDLIKNVLQRQEQVLSEIDSLNVRVEAAIQELSDARKLELAEEARANGTADVDSTENGSDQDTAVKKAA
jgi:hypothetical protein